MQVDIIDLETDNGHITIQVFNRALNLIDTVPRGAPARSFRTCARRTAEPTGCETDGLMSVVNSPRMGVCGYGVGI